SAGKRRSTRIRKGSPWLKTTLVQCAWAATRKKGSYLNAQYHRIRARRGPKKAIVAVAASILTAIYHMLRDGTMYQDLGPNHFDAHAKERQENRLLKRLAVRATAQPDSRCQTDLPPMNCGAPTSRASSSSATDGIAIPSPSQTTLPDTCYCARPSSPPAQDLANLLAWRSRVVSRPAVQKVIGPMSDYLTSQGRR